MPWRRALRRASPLGQPTAGALLRTTAANPCFAAELLAPTYMLRLECEARRRKRHAGGAGRSRTRPALSGMLRTRQAAPCTRSSRRSLPGVCRGARSVRRWGRARGSPAPRPRACTRQAAAASHCEQGRQHAPRQGGAPWAQQEITFAARRRGRAFRADRAASPTALQAPCWLARSQRPPPCVSGAPRSRPVPGTSCALPEAARAGAGSELRGGCEPAPLPLSLQASTCELRLQCEARRRDPVRGRWGAAHRRRIVAPARRCPARCANAKQLHARAAVEEACGECAGGRVPPTAGGRARGSPAPRARRRANHTTACRGPALRAAQVARAPPRWRALGPGGTQICSPPPGQRLPRGARRQLYRTSGRWLTGTKATPATVRVRGATEPPLAGLAPAAATPRFSLRARCGARRALLRRRGQGYSCPPWQGARGGQPAAWA